MESIFLAKRISILVLTVSLLSASQIRANEPFWPDAKFSSDVPTLRATLGYDHGEKITSPADIVRFLEPWRKRSRSNTPRSVR